LEEARERGRQLLAQQDKARKERAELASQVDPPQLPNAPLPWLTKAEELASASPESPLTGLLAQFKLLSEQIHALAVAPPAHPASVPPASLAPDDPPSDAEHVTKGKDRTRSRTPPGGGKGTKKQRSIAGGATKDASRVTESDAEEEDGDTRDGAKTPQ
jgi:hypothetical protein